MKRSVFRADAAGCAVVSPNSVTKGLEYTVALAGMPRGCVEPEPHDARGFVLVAASRRGLIEYYGPFRSEPGYLSHEFVLMEKSR